MYQEGRDAVNECPKCHTLNPDCEQSCLACRFPFQAGTPGVPAPQPERCSAGHPIDPEWEKCPFCEQLSMALSLTGTPTAPPSGSAAATPEVGVEVRSSFKELWSGRYGRHVRVISLILAIALSVGAIWSFLRQRSQLDKPLLVPHLAAPARLNAGSGSPASSEAHLSRLPSGSEGEVTPVLNQPGETPEVNNTGQEVAARQRAASETQRQALPVSEDISPPRRQAAEERATTRKKQTPVSLNERQETAGENVSTADTSPKDSGEVGNSVERFQAMEAAVIAIEKLANAAAGASEKERGEDELTEQLQEFGELATGVRKAFRRATGTNLRGRFRNFLRTPGGGRDADARDLEIKVQDLVRKSREIDLLITARSPSPVVEQYWQEIRQSLKSLAGLF
jgi:hypothetical protein